MTNKPYPQGEIVIGSDSIANGYYKLPERSREEFFEEDGKRWFRTGDIGEIHHDGVLKIIGECLANVNELLVGPIVNVLLFLQTARRT